jgi:hypothetical protein
MPIDLPSSRSILRTLCCGLLLIATGIFARAGEPAETLPVQRALGSDPCGFYRGQAYGRGIGHMATEMLWACEAISARRTAGMPLGDRLLAVELALERYRAAVISAGQAAFARDRRLGLEGRQRDHAKHEIAEHTGALAALEAIRAGF